MGGGVPTCTFVPERGMFRVDVARGKSIYGVLLPERGEGPGSGAGPEAEAGGTEDGQGGGGGGVSVSGEGGISSPSPPRPPPPPRPPTTYVFVEEALFLRERGLLRVWAEDGTSELDLRGLFAMLPGLGVPFAAYATYSHLRAQTYIVLRHSAGRLDLVDRIEELEGTVGSACGDGGDALPGDGTGGGGGGGRGKGGEGPPESGGGRRGGRGRRGERHGILRGLKKRLRAEEAQAPAPSVLLPTESIGPDPDPDPHPDSDPDGPPPPRQSKPPIAFDVYGPNSSFRRSNPGRPEFCVAISPYAAPSPTFTSVLALMTYVRGVPVSLATVADGGTVVMFRLTDYGVPPLSAASTEGD